MFLQKNSHCIHIIGGDFNGWHPLWGSPRANRRGNSIVDLITTNNLIICNSGSHPTFETITHGIHRESIIDLTLTLNSPPNQVLNWKITKDPSPSSSHNELENYVSKLTLAIQNVCKKLFSQKCNFTQRAPWWSDKLEELKQKVLKNHHKLQKLKRGKKSLTEALIEKESLKNEYSQAISAASTEHFREFCNKQGKEDVWSVTNRLLKTTPLSQPPSTLKNKSGHYTCTTQETAETFLKEYFPEDEPDTDPRHIKIRKLSEKIPETPPEPLFTTDEVLHALASMNPNKAPEITKHQQTSKFLPNDIQLEIPAAPAELLHPSERIAIKFLEVTCQEEIEQQEISAFKNYNPETTPYDSPGRAHQNEPGCGAVGPCVRELQRINPNFGGHLVRKPLFESAVTWEHIGLGIPSWGSLNRARGVLLGGV
ncbi:unnamed protein product [Parnassius apollo]|uniref:(apollo) hypothetical protein n=1 Tax=Parnassius apollo TaxID=110799 RepID=A0A8S3YCW5_PARAO|nr:unnamed protein product [Parnassius apollo]